MRAVTTYGVTDYHLGRAAATAGDLHTAVAHFTRAVSRNDRLGAAAWAARSRIALADIRERLGDDAADLRAAGLETARRLDLAADQLVTWP
jgi:CO dehydrogenase/acetyl-CoA synthase alpha subunit